MGVYHSFEQNETATMLFLKKPFLVMFVNIIYLVRKIADAIDPR